MFIIRNGMAFPDLVHALRPNPVNNIQEVRLHTVSVFTFRCACVGHIHVLLVYQL